MKLQICPFRAYYGKVGIGMNIEMMGVMVSFNNDCEYVEIAEKMGDFFNKVLKTKVHDWNVIEVDLEWTGDVHMDTEDVDALYDVSDLSFRVMDNIENLIEQCKDYLNLWSHLVSDEDTLSYIATGYEWMKISDTLQVAEKLKDKLDDTIGDFQKKWEL